MNMNIRNKEDKLLKMNHPKNGANTTFKDNKDNNSAPPQQQQIDKKVKGQEIENNTLPLTNENEKKTTITISFGDKKKRLKVSSLSNTLQELRDSTSWINDNHIFIFEEGEEIDQTDEGEFMISEIINLQSRVVKMKEINDVDQVLSEKKEEYETKLQINQNGELQRKINEDDDDEEIKANQVEKEEEEELREAEQSRKKKLEEEEAYQKSLRFPMKRSKPYGKKGDLEIYLYPQYELKDLNDLERENLQVIMVVGQTGSGKSTMLDSMVNYFSGVQFDYPFRYKLIDEKSIIDSQKIDQSQSITSKVKKYYIKPGPNTRLPPILVIDTPGFMDTKGLERDKQITADIEKFFKTEIDRIHCVCLVSISSNVRLTCSQKYVFNKVLQIFGKDIEENIVNLFTFCDGGEPQVLQAIKKENIPSNYCYKFNNSALFTQTGDNFEKMFWRMNCESLKKFFEDVINNFSAKSLLLTKEVLKERTKLEHTIINIRPRIDVGLRKLEQVKRELEFLVGHIEDLEHNKNFKYLVDVEKFQKVYLNPGVNTTTCRVCNRTCHENCTLKDNKDKDLCCAMTNKYCTVCPKKCHWQNHTNLPYKFEYYIEKEERTQEDLKWKYAVAQQNRSESDRILIGLSQELQKIKVQIYDDIQMLHASLEKLSKIALRPNSYSQIDIINQMIANEDELKKPGYQERISSLEEIKKQYELLSQLTEQDRNRQLQKLSEDYMSTFYDLKNKKKINLCTIF